MSKHVRWLYEQTENWVTQGLIDPEQAARIRKLYPEPKATLPWGTILFSGIGAVVAGLGVILLLAYNWHAIPKVIKLAVIFGALAGAHVTGLRLFQKPDWRRQLGEAVCLLGTMFFGAGIWLVAQIYHIGEHFPNGFLIWGLGALAMAWALPSLAQGLLATVVFCIWGCSEVFGFEAALHWSPLVILIGVGGLAVRLRSPLLLFFVLTGFFVTLLANAGSITGWVMLPVAMSVSVLFVAVGILVQRLGWFPAGGPVWSFFGWLGFLITLYLLTFPEIVEDLLGWAHPRHEEVHWLPLLVYGWAPFFAALGAWGVVAGTRPPAVAHTDRARAGRIEEWLLPLTAIVCQVLAASGIVTQGWEFAGSFNLVFLAVAAMWMAQGCREGELRPTLLGSLLLVALVIARYFDLFESLALRGFVFLAVGGVLFGEGFFYRRARREAEPGREQP